MVYLISFWNISGDNTSFIVSSINSFFSLGGSKESDKLYIYVRKEEISDIQINIIKDIKFIKLFFIEDYFYEFRVYYNQFVDSDNDLSISNASTIFMGIYFSAWVATKIEEGYILIENDIFSTSRKNVIPFKASLNKIQFIQGEQKNENFYTNSLIFYSPPELKLKILNIFTTIMTSSGGETTKLWKEFHLYIDEEMVLNDVMSYWTDAAYKRSKHSFKRKLIHRNNTVIQKEFKSFDLSISDSQIRRSFEIKHNPHTKAEMIRLIKLSNYYFNKLQKISRKYNIPLARDKKQQRKSITNLKRKIFVE